MFCPCSCFGKSRKAYLYAFDFDHTIIDHNSDTAVIEVIHHPIPDDIQHFFNGNNWEEYMEKIFRFIASEGATMEMIANRIRHLKLNAGMGHLLAKIHASRLQRPRSELLVISDANDFFIESYFTGMQPPLKPDFIISNHADKSNEDYLRLTPYENQTTCVLCPKNLCKGEALLKHIEKQGPFNRVFYIGDGGNDICPAMKLQENDIVFVRKGFTMEKIIANRIWKGCLIHIKADIVYWDNAKTIEEFMEF